MFPSEVQLKLIPNCTAYFNLLEAFPGWKGFLHVDLECLVQALKSNDPLIRFSQETLFFALRLLSPVNSDLEIVKIPPSSVINLINFLSTHHGIHLSESSSIFLPLPLLPKFEEWFKLFPENEKERVRKYIFEALLIAGKIDEAFSMPDLLEHSKKIIIASVLWAFLKDDVDGFDKIKSTLRNHKKLRETDIVRLVINAKAKNILRTIFVQDLKGLSANEILLLIFHALTTQDVDLFSTVLNKFSTQKFDTIRLLREWYMHASDNVDMLNLILQQIEYKSLDDKQRQSLFNIIKVLISSDRGNVASFKLLYSWAHELDSAQMDQITLEIIPLALNTKNDFVIKHLLEKDGTGKYKNSLIKPDPILDCFKDTEDYSYRPSPLIIKYLLTKVDSGAGITRWFPGYQGFSVYSELVLPFLN